MKKTDAILLDVARLIWQREISINDFYSSLGINLDDLSMSMPDGEIATLAGILTGWQNSPEESN